MNSGYQPKPPNFMQMSDSITPYNLQGTNMRVRPSLGECSIDGRSGAGPPTLPYGGPAVAPGPVMMTQGDSIV